ncbi:MAG: sigma-70 family RNA polymerase sigma factor [Gemmatimonadaceae bacterium]|nr:sigma-70 family RNA polymerase sigma factor [Gemmatimonadaceae bacterium]
MSDDALDVTWRRERARLVATLAARLGDLDLAEDAVQDAIVAALRRWPLDGVPQNPGAWLNTAAWRRALDLRRRARPTVEWSEVPDTRLATVTADAAEPNAAMIDDDVLRLMFACCDPELPPDTRLALTLRHVAGLSTRQIAAALLVQESAVEKRLVRARARLRSRGIDTELPPAASLPARLADVHAVIYVLFTEGYLAAGDDAARRDALCDDAVWLASQVVRAIPDDAESLGLLALLTLQHSRRAARSNPEGALVTFAEQSRAEWDADAIVQARTWLARAPRERPGPYQLEAAIALLHATAPAPDALPWPHIAALYDLRLAIDGSPVVAVNRAVAIGRARGASHGLAALGPALDDRRMRDYVPLHVAHADLLEQCGAVDAARRAWDRAAAVASNPGARREIARRRALLG